MITNFRIRGLSTFFVGHYLSHSELVASDPNITGYSKPNHSRDKIINRAKKEHAEGKYDLLGLYLDKQRTNTVLELGGSNGECWYGFQSDYDLDYHIVETEQCVEYGKERFKDFPKLSYHTQIPDLGKIDIFYCRTSLQYAEDWRKTLTDVITKNKPNLIILDRTELEETEETHYISQVFQFTHDLFASIMPYCIINGSDLNSFLSSGGYQQINGTKNCEEERHWFNDYEPDARIKIKNIATYSLVYAAI